MCYIYKSIYSTKMHRFMQEIGDHTFFNGVIILYIAMLAIDIFQIVS